MKKKHISSTFIFVLIFFIGLVVLLYPSASNYINQIGAVKAVVNYDQTIAGMGQEENEKLLAAADDYNSRLDEGSSFALKNGAPSDPEYESLLNVTGNGMMGYITIKKLNVTLPIYHGTSDDVLAKAAGHLEGSSLPVGGEGSHSVLTGHRGLPSAKLFTDLDKMEVGDTFSISVLSRTLTYEVDDISIVLPDDLSKIKPIPGGDYVTLVTCTPYAVNTHRLLVRGKRIDNPEGEIRVIADAMQIDPILVAPLVAAPILLILLILLLTAPMRRKKSPVTEDTGRSTVTEQKNDSISPKDGGTE